MRLAPWTRTGIPALVALTLTSTASAQTGSTETTFQQLTRAGITALDVPAAAGPIADANVPVRIEHDLPLVDARRGELHSAPPPAALTVPAPSGGAVSPVPSRGVSGFAGLTHADQRGAGTGIYRNTQFSSEPPDQALCVGNGFVMESANTALAVHNAATGARVAGPTALNQFFLLAPAVIRSSPPVFGDFTSDPKCYYDAQTRRWFVSLLQINVNPATGGFARPGGSHILLAVSQTADPRAAFNLFRIDTTNAGGPGMPSHPRCPCLGDQPLIGADENGLFISTNEFPIFRSGFNGAQIYALSKRKLAAGVMPTVVHIDGGPLEEGPSYSVQPATSPDLGRDDDDNQGVEFFLSALDFEGTLDNRIAVWALTNTRSLTKAAPDVALSHIVIGSEVYGQPPDADQKIGPTPLRTATGIPDPEALIAANDDRMNQVVFADGLLWSGVNTIVSGDRVGIAWFAVRPSLKNSRLRAKIQGQGYVSAAGNSVLYPSIGVNREGEAVIGFSLTGQDFFPSAAYARVSVEHGAGPVHIAAAGAAPEDGFSGYPSLGGDVAARWGDYSAAVADEYGNLWFAAEYIPNAPRTALANWGTFIGKITVDRDDDR
ncbi:MAG: hypothetical protein JWL71_2738 [Acidobacteria bacterium]|nr:hypothetical protein [Acidobacteriota bacterium]